MNTLKISLFTRKPYVTLLTLWLCITAIAYRYHQRLVLPDNPYAQEIALDYTDKNLNVNDYYKDRFASQEAELWEKLTTEKNVSKAQCLQEQEAFRKRYQKNLPKNGSKALPRETLDMIHSVTAECGISPEKLIIVERDMNQCPAASDDFVLYVNLYWLSTYPRPVQEFIIAHECSHMICKDPSLQTVLTDHISESDPLWREYLLFCETRADIMASIRHSKYAQAGIEYSQALFKKYGNQDYANHPDNTTREQTHQTILALLQQAPSLA